MSGNYTGQCLGCGGWGHRRANCPDLMGGTESVDESVNRQPPAGGAAAFRARLGHGPGSFSGRFSNQPQQRHQQSSMNVTGLQVGFLHDANPASVTAGFEAFKQQTGCQNATLVYMDEQAGRDTQDFIASMAESRQAFFNKRNKRHLDTGAIPVMRRPDTVGSVRPQRQSGPGALPGDRNAQSNRAGGGLLGHHRVERPGADRGRRGGRQEPTVGGHEPVARRLGFEGFDPNASDPEDGRPDLTGHRSRAQDSMAQEPVEVNSNGPDAEEAPVVEDGRSGAGRAREMRPRAAQYVVTRTTPDGFVGTNLDAQDVESLIARAFRRFPEGTRFNVQITPVSAVDDDAALDEIIENRFPGSSDRFPDSSI